jgi:membrane associated rhomboid family serine protease
LLSILFVVIGMNILISYQVFKSNQWRDKLILSPYLIKHDGQWYRLFSHSWIHADWQHLLFNMASLYFLGDLILNNWIDLYGDIKGTGLFLFLYLAGGIAATIFPYFKNQDNSSYRALGASGAVSAVIFAAILWNPTMKLGILFIPFPIPAYIFGPLYLLIEYFAMRNIKTGVAHDAHLGGALFGILFVLFLNLDKGKDFVNLFF